MEHNLYNRKPPKLYPVFPLDFVFQLWPPPRNWMTSKGWKDDALQGILEEATETTREETWIFGVIPESKHRLNTSSLVKCLSKLLENKHLEPTEIKEVQ